MKPPSGPQSVIWFLALNSYKHDSASVVASACFTSWLNYDFIFVSFLPHLSSLKPRSKKELSSCCKNSFQVFQYFKKGCSLHIATPYSWLPVWWLSNLTDLDMQILDVTSPVGCLGAVVPIRSQICQGLCRLWIRIEVYLYLTSHVDEIVQVWRLASKVGRSS